MYVSVCKLIYPGKVSKLLELLSSCMLRKVRPPPSIGISPAQMASTSAAVSYIISQINSNDADTCCKAITQVQNSLLMYMTLGVAFWPKLS